MTHGPILNPHDPNAKITPDEVKNGVLEPYHTAANERAVARLERLFMRQTEKKSS